MFERKVSWSYLVFCVALILFCSSTHSLGTAPYDKNYIHEEVLPNGLALLIKENHSAPIAHVRVYVKTGSIYEGEYIGSGISHHIEHLVSGGSTSNKTEAEYEEIISFLGGACNAYTSKDHTCYFISSSSENLPLMLETLSDWVFNCIFTEEEFEREHGVIQREIELGMEEPRRRLSQLTMQTGFKVHPVKYPTIGYLENFLRLKREDLLKYYERWYVPENMVVVIVGDVKTKPTVDLVKKTFGKYPRKSPPLVTLPEEPPQISTRVATEEMDVQIAYLRLAYRTVPISHPDLYALDLLSYILTHGESAILVKKIRDELRLVSNITSYSATPGYDAGYFAITAALHPEKLDQAREAIVEELENLKRAEIDESLLERAKKQKITEYVFENQTMEEQASNIGWSYLTTHDKDFYAKYVEKIQKVPSEDIKRVLNTYFTSDNLTIVRIVPKGYEASEKTPIVEPTSQEIKKTSLDNGMTLLTKVDDTTPMVTILAVYKGGVLYETEENNGISNFMVRMLLKGTEKLSAEEISEKLDNMGIEVSARGGNNTFYIGFNLVSSDFDQALSLFSDIIKNPTFPSDEIEKMRERLLAELARRKGDWYFEAASFFRQNFFAHHPYGMVPEGTEESLRDITRQDLINFYNRFCRPDNMVLAIFGDIGDLLQESSEKFEEKVNRLFSDYSVKTPLILPVNRPEPELVENRRATKYTDRGIAVVYMGYPGMRVDDLGDRYPMEVLDAIISGINYPGGWLHQKLRGNELVYAVHAFNWMGADPGYFGIYAATTPEKVDQVIELISEQMDRIKVEDIPDEEFNRAKSICVTMEKLSHQSNYEQALRSALDELYGLGYDFYKEHQSGIEAVSEEDVRRVANKYFKNYVLVITTPKGDTESGE